MHTAIIAIFRIIVITIIIITTTIVITMAFIIITTIILTNMLLPMPKPGVQCRVVAQEAARYSGAIGTSDCR